MFSYIILFDKKITMYSIMSIIGIFVSGIFACKQIKKKNNSDNDMISLLLISSVGVFLGGHILYGITNINFIIKVLNNSYLIKSFKDLLDIIVYIFGGSVFYGGLIGGLIVGSFYINIKNLNKTIFYDICALIIPLFHVFGRVGCFLSGCCYGIKSKFGIVYRHAIIEQANYVSRFPIQLVEAFYCLLIFCFLYVLYKNNKFKGYLISLYLFLYPLGRFLFEFLRGDSYRGTIFCFSTSQFISIVLIIFNIIWILNKTKYKKEPNF